MRLNEIESLEKIEHKCRFEYDELLIILAVLYMVFMLPY